ncbi:MAG: endonuclease, partial [Woeseiaceae bacterium]
DETHIEEHSFASDDGGASPLNDRALDDVSLGENKDDLKQIKGVGPAIEKTLNELGIFRLSQIAAMSEYDIDRVAKRLKGFRSRIYREDWMGQARELQDGDAGKQA